MHRFALIAVCSFLLLAAAPKKETGWSPVEQAFGRAGMTLPGGVYKVAFPRTDLQVVVDGVTIKPALALGSWAAFKEIGAGKAMTMGDLVLLESEVNPVIDALQHGGIEQTALHNHLSEETPRVMYMHFMGTGNAAALARTLHDALALTKTPMGTPAAGPASTSIDLPTADLDRILRSSGKVAGGTYQFSVARAGAIRERGVEVPPAMGVAMGLNFQPTENGRAVVTGDLVMVASEVNPAIRALRSGGIAITALHSHMLEEEPRLFFMHFWGNGDAKALAATLRKALDVMAVKR